MSGEKPIAVDQDGNIDIKPRDYLFQRLLPLLPEYDPDKLWNCLAVDPMKWKYLVSLTFNKNVAMLKDEIDQLIQKA